MFHPGTSALIAAWTALPNSGRIPARADFDPMVLAPLLPRLWSAERRDDDRWIVRLAGGWIERLHGAPLAGADWAEVWRADTRALVLSAIQQGVREARPVVTIADSPHLAAPLEVVVAPLRDRSAVARRLIGLYQPQDPGDMAAESIGPLSARLTVSSGESRRPPLSLAALDGRRIA